MESAGVEVTADSLAKYLLPIFTDCSLKEGKVQLTRHYITSSSSCTFCLPNFEIGKEVGDIVGSCMGVVCAFSNEKIDGKDSSNPLIGGHFIGEHDEQVHSWLVYISRKLEVALADIGIASALVWGKRNSQRKLEIYAAVRGWNATNDSLRETAPVIHSASAFICEECQLSPNGVGGQPVRFWVPYNLLAGLIRKLSPIPSRIAPVQCIWLGSSTVSPQQQLLEGTFQRICLENVRRGINMRLSLKFPGSNSTQFLQKQFSNVPVLLSNDEDSGNKVKVSLCDGPGNDEGDLVLESRKLTIDLIKDMLCSSDARLFSICRDGLTLVTCCKECKMMRVGNERAAVAIDISNNSVGSACYGCDEQQQSSGCFFCNAQIDSSVLNYILFVDMNI